MSESTLATVVYNGETAPFSAASTWDQNGSTLKQIVLSPHTPRNHLRANIISKKLNGSVAYLPANNQSYDMSKYQTLSFWAKSGNLPTVLVSLYDANKKTSKAIAVNITASYLQYSIPLTSFTDVDLTRTTAIVFTVNQLGTNVVLDIDDIELTGSACQTPTPTPTPDPTPTPTPDPTPTPTPDPTPTPTPSGVDYQGVSGPRPTNTQTTGDVTFSINLAVKAPISPYIYGYQGFAGTWIKEANFSLIRAGGNRWSAYNWENGISHAGSDWLYQNDDSLCSSLGATIPNCLTTPASVTKYFLDQAFNKNGSGMRSEAAILTIPMLDYVSYKATNGDVCPVGSITSTNECTTRSYLSTVFRSSKPKKGSAFSLIPNVTDTDVYQDEYANWISNYQKTVVPDKKIFLSLDNEYALWGSTHNRIRPGGDYCVHNPTPTEILSKTLALGSALKAAYPSAIVLGPVSYGWYELTDFQGFNSCDNSGPFVDFYLKGIKGKNAVDVFDFHWYPEARGNVGRITEGNGTDNIDARLQSTRSFWDPTYIETSWITENLGNQPIKLFSRLREKINAYNPGMGLSITEYNHGGENHISGAIAQADALGIFGRDGLFAATYWPLSSDQKYIFGTFKMFRNYDGLYSTFGNTALSSVTNGTVRSSVYASIFNSDPSKMLVVAINKTAQPLVANLSITGNTYSNMAVYQLTSTPDPKYIGTSTFTGKYTMPAYSISTLVLTKTALAKKAKK